MDKLLRKIGIKRDKSTGCCSSEKEADIDASFPENMPQSEQAQGLQETVSGDQQISNTIDLDEIGRLIEETNCELDNKHKDNRMLQRGLRREQRVLATLQQELAQSVRELKQTQQAYNAVTEEQAHTRAALTTLLQHDVPLYEEEVNKYEPDIFKQYETISVPTDCGAVFKLIQKKQNALHKLDCLLRRKQKNMIATVRRKRKPNQSKPVWKDLSVVLDAESPLSEAGSSTESPTVVTRVQLSMREKGPENDGATSTSKDESTPLVNDIIDALLSVHQARKDGDITQMLETAL